MDVETEAAKEARKAPHQLVIPTEAQLPQAARSFGPLVYWSEARPGTPSGLPRVAQLVFRPTRFTLNELWTDVPRPVSDSPWQLSYALASRSECRLLQTIFEDHGFELTTSNTFNILWLSCPVKPALLLGLNKYQKVNHFPRTQELTRKDLLARTLGSLREAHGPSACDFLPQTFVLPADYDALHAAMARERVAWIVKPVASSCGRGISIVQQPHQLPHEDVVVSRYIANPLLIDGFKFDLRIYVAVTSFYPLRCYVYEDGLARFSTERYQNSGSGGYKNVFMHLTNYSINKHSAHFVENTDASSDDHGNKWSLSALKRCLARNGVDVPALFARIDALIVRTLIAVEPSVVSACRRYCGHKNCCFQLLGFDVLIDDALKPWLLEVNLSPSLGTDSPLDLKVSHPRTLRCPCARPPPPSLPAAAPRRRTRTSRRPRTRSPTHARTAKSVRGLSPWPCGVQMRCHNCSCSIERRRAILFGAARFSRQARTLFWQTSKRGSAPRADCVRIACGLRALLNPIASCPPWFRCVDARFGARAGQG